MMMSRIEEYLDDLFSDPKCELNYTKDYELLIAVMLSAQTTDKRVNIVTEVLFNKYLNGNETYKNHLLAQIQMVLEGKLVLEDMLNNEGIVLDNSSD